MPRFTREELHQAVLDILPAGGEWMLYEDLIAQLETQGLYQATAELRGMKAREDVQMRVRMTDSGQAVHEVRKA